MNVTVMGSVSISMLIWSIVLVQDNCIADSYLRPEWNSENIGSIELSGYVNSMSSGIQGMNKYICISELDENNISWRVVIGGSDKLVFLDSEGTLEEYQLDLPIYTILQDHIGDHIAIQYYRNLNDCVTELISREDGNIEIVVDSEDVGRSQYVSKYTKDEELYYYTLDGLVGSFTQSNGLRQHSINEAVRTDLPVSRLALSEQAGCFAVRANDSQEDVLICWNERDGHLFSKVIGPYSRTNTLLDASRSGNIVCVQRNNDGLVAIDGFTGELEHEYFLGSQIRSLRLSPSGKYLAVVYRPMVTGAHESEVQIECINVESGAIEFVQVVSEIDIGESCVIHQVCNDGSVVVEGSTRSDREASICIAMLASTGDLIWRTNSFDFNNSVLNGYSDNTLSEVTIAGGNKDYIISYFDTETATINIDRIWSSQ